MGRAGSAGEDPDTFARRPVDLDRRVRRFVLRRTVREFLNDDCTDLAATLTYYAVLALFPGLLAIVSLLGVVGQAEQTTAALLSAVERFVPSSALAVVRPYVLSLTQSSAAGYTLVAGVATSLWSASGYVRAFSRAMNRIYDVGEGRPIWRLLPQQLLVTVLAVLLVCLGAVLLVVSGPVARTLGGLLGLGSAAVATWDVAKWPVLVSVVVLVIAILYGATPNVRQPGFRWMVPGALVAVLVWAAASTGFAFYVANFGSYNKTYGALAGVVIFLLWLWITNLALLLGAEVNAELERGRELQAGLPAEEQLQLPLRDTRQLEKARATTREALAEAAEIRRRGQPEG